MSFAPNSTLLRIQSQTTTPLLQLPAARPTQWFPLLRWVSARACVCNTARRDRERPVLQRRRPAPPFHLMPSLAPAVLPYTGIARESHYVQSRSIDRAMISGTHVVMHMSVYEVYTLQTSQNENLPDFLVAQLAHYRSSFHSLFT